MSLGEIVSLLLRAVMCLRMGSTVSCIELARQAHELLGRWLLDPARAEAGQVGEETFFWDECHAADPCHDN